MSTLSFQDWYYDRSKLVYMRELGEGQFGKVLLMKATVNQRRFHNSAFRRISLSLFTPQDIAGHAGSLPVAAKTLSSTDDDDIRKFHEEVGLMKRFCHPNIVSLLGKGSSDGHRTGLPS